LIPWRELQSAPGAHGRRLSLVDARVDYILKEALALATEERSALVVALLGSLETSADPNISDAWRKEIRRRRIALRAGATRPVPWSDARARLHSLRPASPPRSARGGSRHLRSLSMAPRGQLLAADGFRSEVF